MENLVTDPAFWSGKRVFITGHTGFKGSWLSLWLQRLGADIVGYSLPAPTTPSLFALAKIADGMVSLTGDVRDREQLSAAVRQCRPEIVLHLAAQSLVRESYHDPVGTYSTNVMGTVHLLEAVRGVDSVRSVVVVSSDKCYENREWAWGYRENEPMGGHDPYSSSKGCTELVTSAYRRSFFTAAERIATASGRAGNVIGGGDWAMDRLVPDMMRSFAAGESVLIRNPEAVRPWQHVLEPLDGYLTLAQRLNQNGASFAEAWNFGPDDSGSAAVARIADYLRDAWGDGASWHTEAAARPHEATLLKLDCSKARARLHWKAKLSLEQTLDWVIEWYRCHQRGGDVRGLTEDQITRYQHLA